MDALVCSAIHPISSHALWHLLYPRERAILVRQERGDTLATIGRDLGISRGRVCQIRDRARFVLSRPSRLQRQRIATYAANPQAFAVDP